jgi:hypothetical protein
VDRAFGSEPKGRKFNSCRAYQFLQLLTAFVSVDGVSLLQQTQTQNTRKRAEGPERKVSGPAAAPFIRITGSNIDLIIASAEM